MIRGFQKISLDQWNKDYNKQDSNEIYDKIKIPYRATKNSAGYDFYCPFDIKIYPNESIKIPTGIKSYMQPNEFLMIVPRSSMGFKYFMRLANTVAIGDSDYFDNSDNEGHYWIKIRNENDEPMEIKKGQAFAQAIFMQYLIADDDNSMKERMGGLGSTN